MTTASATDLPPSLALLEAQGAQISKPFQAQASLTAYTLRVDGRELMAYVMPDNKHILIGSLIDENGNNLTLAYLQKQRPPIVGNDIWKKLAGATWLAVGAEKPKRIVYSFTDPNCPYCHEFWEAAKPFYEAGLQVRYIPVAILAPTSMTKAAAILDADDPVAALTLHEENRSSGGIEVDAEPSPEARSKLERNNKLMQELGAHATPATMYLDPEEEVQVTVGLPPTELLEEKIFRLSP